MEVEKMCFHMNEQTAKKKKSFYSGTLMDT